MFIFQICCVFSLSLSYFFFLCFVLRFIISIHLHCSSNSPSEDQWANVLNVTFSCETLFISAYALRESCAHHHYVHIWTDCVRRWRSLSLRVQPFHFDIISYALYIFRYIYKLVQCFWFVMWIVEIWFDTVFRWSLISFSGLKTKKKLGSQIIDNDVAHLDRDDRPRISE